MSAQPSPAPIINRQLVSACFTQQQADHSKWLCKCGILVKQKGSGYTNLLSHIARHHPQFPQLDRNASASSIKQFSQFCYPRKAHVIFAWLQIIITGLRPFSTCEDWVLRRHIKADPISLNTFMKYLSALTEKVEAKITTLLPDKFGLVFDGWTEGDTHYLAIFASIPDKKNTTGFRKLLLTFSPMGEEESLNANEHYRFFCYILELYSKNWANVAALIGDNCATNKALTGKAGMRFIGCASHRFNLAVQDYLVEYESVIAQVHGLMTKLKNLIPAAKLRKLTHLRAKTSNKTRWSSTHDMLIRYQQIRDLLAEVGLKEIDELLLTTIQNRLIDKLVEELTELNSVKKTLQRDNITLADVRFVFETVFEDFNWEGIEKRLATEAPLVHDPHFEFAVVKVMDGDPHRLNSEEDLSLAHLKLETYTDSSDDMSVPSLAERALKKRRVRQMGLEKDYPDLRFLLPTSNIVERLFSKAGYALGDRRRGVLSGNFESQMFLHFNQELWGLEDIAEIIANDRNNSQE